MCSLIANRFQLCERHSFKFISRRQTVEGALVAFQYQTFQHHVISRNTLVADADESSAIAVSKIEIGRFVTRSYLENNQFLAIVSFMKAKIHLRHWIHLRFYLLTDNLCIMLGIFQPYNLSAVGNTKYQSSTFTIGKGTHALQPTLGLPLFKHLLLIVSCCLPDK